MNAASPSPSASSRIIVVGAGPAGLMAAETLIAAGHRVDVYDAMPSAGRKLLLAGLGGLNLTHAEPFAAFVTRYGERQSQFEPLLRRFGAGELCAWAHALGIETFVGSSERVFPTGMKAAPLLRAWLQRLREQGVCFHARHRWQGWNREDAAPTRGLRFAAPPGECLVDGAAVVLALGGASWPQLGSDGAWTGLLRQRGVDSAALKPANCGFDIAPTADGRSGWSDYLRVRFAGQPLKNVALSFSDRDGRTQRRNGECLLSDYGLEGSLIYALSAPLRDAILAAGEVTVHLDLLPQRDPAWLRSELARPRGSRSLSGHLRSKIGLSGVKTALLHECASPAELANPLRLAALLKALPLRLSSPRPIEEAISSAGGVKFEEMNDRLMLRNLPGVFCCGEMLDWEAPTGGYLLTGCFSTGHAAGLGVAAWLQQRDRAT